MSLFNPVNVAGPAHRGPQIAQMAQNAAQNVLRKQKLRALLQHTTGAHAGVGQAQPFRSSLAAHGSAMRPGVIRPGAAMAAGNAPSFAGGNAPGFAPPGPFGPDPGQPDLASLPSPTDPAQSPSSTQPVVTHLPAGFTPGGDASTARPIVNQLPAGFDASTAQPIVNQLPAGFGAAPPAHWIPLGGGQFYDPTTDSIQGGSAAVKPGLQM